MKNRFWCFRSQNYSATGKYSLELKLLLLWTIMIGNYFIKNVLWQKLTPVMPKTKNFRKKAQVYRMYSIRCLISQRKCKYVHGHRIVYWLYITDLNMFNNKKFEGIVRNKYFLAYLSSKFLLKTQIKWLYTIIHVEYYIILELKAFNYCQQLRSEVKSEPYGWKYLVLGQLWNDISNYCNKWACTTTGTCTVY